MTHRLCFILTEYFIILIVQCYFWSLEPTKPFFFFFLSLTYFPWAWALSPWWAQMDITAPCLPPKPHPRLFVKPIQDFSGLWDGPQNKQEQLEHRIEMVSHGRVQGRAQKLDQYRRFCPSHPNFFPVTQRPVFMPHGKLSIFPLKITFYLFILWVCMCVPGHSACVEVRRQFAGVGSFLPPCGSQE